MAENDYVQGEMDINMQKGTYEAVMRVGSRHGVGFSLGLALFFTMLLLNSGIILAIFGAIVVYIATYWIVKLFFTH